MSGATYANVRRRLVRASGTAVEDNVELEDCIRQSIQCDYERAQACGTNLGSDEPGVVRHKRELVIREVDVTGRFYFKVDDVALKAG